MFEIISLYTFGVHSDAGVKAHLLGEFYPRTFGAWGAHTADFVLRVTRCGRVWKQMGRENRKYVELKSQVSRREYKIAC